MKSIVHRSWRAFSCKERSQTWECAFKLLHGSWNVWFTCLKCQSLQYNVAPLVLMMQDIL